MVRSQRREDFSQTREDLTQTRENSSQTRLDFGQRRQDFGKNRMVCRKSRIILNILCVLRLYASLWSDPHSPIRPDSTSPILQIRASEHSP